MVKVKKNKKKEDLSEKKRKQADADAKAAEDAKKREEEKTTSKEPTLLPTYKINLKKQSDNSNAKMKGASLSLLGGYDSASGSSNDSDDWSVYLFSLFFVSLSCFVYRFFLICCIIQCSTTIIYNQIIKPPNFPGVILYT